jgi:uncharacterized protein YidB (DUF937 family)
MDLMQLGTQLLSSKLGNGVNSGSVTSVPGSLLSGSDGQANLGGIIAAMQGKGLGAIAESWLGDGDNADISTDQVREVIGNDKITEMASQLNTDEGSLLDGLKDALPKIIDKSSSGGSLLGSAGDLLGMAKKFFQAAQEDRRPRHRAFPLFGYANGERCPVLKQDQQHASAAYCCFNQARMKSWHSSCTWRFCRLRPQPAFPAHTTT